MLTVLAERGFSNEEVIAAASEKSVGKEIDFAGRRLTVVSVAEAIAARPQYAIFSAGAAASREYAPLFVAAGTTVIDNSSAWRKEPSSSLRSQRKKRWSIFFITRRPPKSKWG